MSRAAINSSAHLARGWEVTTEEPRKKLLWHLREKFVLWEEACGGQNIQGQVYIWEKTTSCVYIADSFAEWANEETVVGRWCQAFLLGKIWSVCIVQWQLPWGPASNMTNPTDRRTRWNWTPFSLTTVKVWCRPNLFDYSALLISLFFSPHIWTAGLSLPPFPMNAHADVMHIALPDGKHMSWERNIGGRGFVIGADQLSARAELKLTFSRAFFSLIVHAAGAALKEPDLQLLPLLTAM